MHRLNWLFTLSSLSVLLVTVERFSFTTDILLKPHEYLRLHEFIQITAIILLTVVIPVFLLREITGNFKNFKQKEFYLLLLFIIGVYFYAAGNGVHELASFLFNNYCNTKVVIGNLCGGFFVNDYYFGNILYFIGGFAMIASLLLLEKERPNLSFKKKDFLIAGLNAVVYAFAIFAYAAFDRVLVGMAYCVITTVFVLILFLPIRKNYLRYPVTSYTLLTYLLGTISALLVRFVI